MALLHSIKRVPLAHARLSSQGNGHYTVMLIMYTQNCFTGKHSTEANKGQRARQPTPVKCGSWGEEVLATQNDSREWQVKIPALCGSHVTYCTAGSLHKLPYLSLPGTSR